MLFSPTQSKEFIQFIHFDPDNRICEHVAYTHLSEVCGMCSKKQTLDDAYAAPANFLEIDVINPITHGVAQKRYTDYECRLKVRYGSTALVHWMKSPAPW